MAEIKAAGVDKLGMVTDPSAPEPEEEKDPQKANG
jgi:hypothetical protein